VTAPSRVALVTGGSRGIGAAICQRLARSDFSVAVNFVRNEHGAEAVVRAIRADDGNAVALRADVADPAQVTRLVAECERQLGPVSVLVNNAGVSELVSARRQTPEQWDRTIAVNLSAAYYGTHAVLAGMIDRRWGRIICIGSPVASRVPLAGQSAYAAAKAGLGAMVRSIAKEVSRAGVTINVVTPGFVETDMTQATGAAGMAFMERNWPKVPAEAVADCVSFLTSDSSAAVSGEDIGVWLGGPSYRP
jgi:3-oxoacyl-[acyl-carrier protein] reductase